MWRTQHRLNPLSRIIQHQLHSSRVMIQTYFLISDSIRLSRRRKSRAMIAILIQRSHHSNSNRNQPKAAFSLTHLQVYLNNSSLFWPSNPRRKFQTSRRMTFRRWVRRSMIWSRPSLTSKTVAARPSSSLHKCKIPMDLIARWVSSISKRPSHRADRRPCQTTPQTWACQVKCSNSNTLALIRGMALFLSSLRTNHPPNKTPLASTRFYKAGLRVNNNNSNSSSELAPSILEWGNQCNQCSQIRKPWWAT